MKNLIKNNLYLTLSILIMPAFSMQPTSQAVRKIWQEFAKKLISKSCTAAYWGISAGSFIPNGLIGIGWHIFNEKICDTFNEMDNGIDHYIQDENGNQKPIYRNKKFALASEPIRNFVDEQAKKMGLKVTPPVRTWNNNRDMVTLYKTLMIDDQYSSQLETILQTNDEQQKNEVASILQHELTHVKNNDGLSEAIERCIVPLLTHQLIKSASTMIPYNQKILPFWLQQGIKLASGAGLYLLNSAILSASSRYKEQRADNGICDDITTLQAQRDYCVKIRDRRAKINNRLNPQPTALMHLEEKFNYYLFATHPTMDDRIARFNKRIEILKNENHS